MIEPWAFLRERECPPLREQFVHRSAFLVGTFGHVNEGNISIQSPAVTILDTAEKLHALLAKLLHWKKRLEVDNYSKSCQFLCSHKSEDTRKHCRTLLN